MSYHTAVTISHDFYTTLKQARLIAEDIKSNIMEYDQSAIFFPYRYKHNKMIKIIQMSFIAKLTKHEFRLQYILCVL